MKVLPIVGRELREGSRRGGTYWMRTRVAGLALAIGIGSFALTLVNPMAKLGTSLFWGLAGVSMLFCLFAGRRSTADCVSLEKREGTLGLLFLTDLKGYDVVLGKLAATSVTGLYALLAVFPMLAVPLLTGGMSRGEVGRMVLVLVNTFFFSSAIGIFASAISREYRTAMAANFLLWLAIVGLPAGIGCGIYVAKSLWIWPLFYSCPIFSFIQTADTIYATGAVDFWLSISVTAALTCLLTVGACAIVPRTWGDKPPRKASRRAWWRNDLNSLVNYGPVEGRIAFRRNALNTNAYFWHAARARLKPIHVWLFIGLGTVWWFYCWFKDGHIWLNEITYVFTAVIVNSAFKLWIALEAGQRLGEDRRSGAFELLLPTPLTVSDILRGQWLALRRQFWRPLLIVFVTELVIIAQIPRTQRTTEGIVVAMLIVLPFDLVALVWVSMLGALTAKTQMRATMLAVSRILILPWVFLGLLLGCIAVYKWLLFTSWNPSSYDLTVAWLILSLAVDATYGVWAWRSVRREFRLMATQNWKPLGWRILINKAGEAIWALAIRLPARVKIPVGLAFVVLVAAGLLMKQKPARFPSPVTASITQSNAPLQIFRAGPRGVFFLLPDGSLWRWGKTGVRQNSFAAMPEQVGTNHDWLKVRANGQNTFALRSDGTIWNIGSVNQADADELHPAIDGTNWADIGSANPYYSVALEKNGTIWKWQPLVPASVRAPEQIGTASNWTAVSFRDLQYVGLRSDGTLWTWGTIYSGRNGAVWFATNIDQPTLVCADTNWVGLDGEALARNQSGEIWDVSFGLPKQNASISFVGERVLSGAVAYRVEQSPYRMNCELRTNGALWIAPSASVSWNWNPAGSFTEGAKQFETRSDWTALWGVNGTAFGMSRDGTLWIWGYDLGRETALTATARVQMMQAALSKGSFNPFRWNAGGMPPPILTEPRPVMKLSVK